MLEVGGSIVLLFSLLAVTAWYIDNVAGWGFGKYNLYLLSLWLLQCSCTFAFAYALICFVRWLKV